MYAQIVSSPNIAINLIQIASPELPPLGKRLPILLIILAIIYIINGYAQPEGNNFPLFFYKFYRLGQSHDNMMETNSI